MMRIGVLCLLMLSHPCVNGAEEKPVLYTQKQLSLESANKIAWAAIHECRKRGYSVAVAVVDRGGNLQAFLRDRFAGPHSPDTAFQKAWTANSYRQDTAVLAEMLHNGAIPNQVQHNPGSLLLGGGVVIRAQGVVVGGVGVSGAPPGKTERDSLDGVCARAGVEKIQQDLEFAD